MLKRVLVALVMLVTLNSAVADPTSEGAHLRELALTASQISGYPMPENPKLRVLIVEPEVINAIVCSGHPCPVLGLYQDQNVIFVVTGYTVHDTDVIILHEMVHWLQHNSGEWAPVTEATRQERYVREIEAHAADQEYMINHQHRCRADNAEDLGDFCPNPAGVVGPPTIHKGDPQS